MSNDVEIIRGFLIPREVYALRELAEQVEWAPGRQGTGYLKHAITEYALGSVMMGPAVRAALYALGARTTTCFSGTWDAYLLRYPEGTEIPFHKDPSPEDGKRHRRLNAILTRSDFGGYLQVHGPNGYCYDGSPGDALMFYPSEIEHAVTKVGGGERLVLSVGALVRS